jgi:iron(III) transport system substrate-binding protein
MTTKKTYVNNVISKTPFFITFLMMVFATSMQTIYAVASDKQSITVYSARSKHLIAPFFKSFEQETGINVRYINGKAGALRQKLLLEKENTPADILFTVDAGNLWKAAAEGLLAETPSPILNQNIPQHLRDEKNRWFALTVRARTLVYSPELVNSSEITNYVDLSKPQWKNRLCLRTSKKIYNQSLVAMLIHHYGEEKTESIVRGWVNNLAKKPYAKDSHVIKAVVKGDCAVGLVNTYYYGRQVKKDSNFSNKVKLAWVGQRPEDFGTHINISGAGIIKYSKNKKNALRLIEWLSKKNIQVRFASLNLEYPANPQATLSPIMESWGKFKRDESSLRYAGEYQVKAVKLMDRTGYK